MKFVTDMYNAGAKGHFDILSLHLYDDPFAVGQLEHLEHGVPLFPVGAVGDGRARRQRDSDRVDRDQAARPRSTAKPGKPTIVGHDFDALNSDPRIAFILRILDDGRCRHRPAGFRVAAARSVASSRLGRVPQPGHRLNALKARSRA